MSWSTFFSSFVDRVTTAGWWWSTLRLDQAAKTVYGKHWKDGDSEPAAWGTEAVYTSLLPARMMAFTNLRTIDQGDHDWELAEFQWRRV